MGTERRREPWPWILAGMLATMIAISTTFLWTALAHPDPPVVDDAYRAGLEYAEGIEVPGLPHAAPEADPDAAQPGVGTGP